MRRSKSLSVKHFSALKSNTMMIRIFVFILALFPHHVIQKDCIERRYFYRKITNDGQEETGVLGNQPAINSEFYKCGRAESCTHLVKFKDTNTYKMVHGEAELKSINHPVIVWKKEAEMVPKAEWIVIQRRIDASVNFTRNWEDYKFGFGCPPGNFWIGLDKLHVLAGHGKGAILNITMKHRSYPNKVFYATYSVFEIGNETDGYRLRIGGYSGNAGDSMRMKYHNGMKFSTYDRDNDIKENANCALKYKGGWWYNRCMWSGLNNLYPDSTAKRPKYMSWITISKQFGNIIMSEMKIKVRDQIQND